MNRRQYATILTGLRLIQSVGTLPPAFNMIATNGDQLDPLTDAEIDELYDMLDTHDLHVVATGDAFNGLTLTGPFAGHDAALEHAELLVGESWNVVQLEPQQ